SLSLSGERSRKKASKSAPSVLTWFSCRNFSSAADMSSVPGPGPLEKASKKRTLAESKQRTRLGMTEPRASAPMGVEGPPLGLLHPDLVAGAVDLDHLAPLHAGHQRMPVGQPHHRTGI